MVERTAVECAANFVLQKPSDFLWIAQHVEVGSRCVLIDGFAEN
jgi:hypothetical protein